MNFKNIGDFFEKNGAGLAAVASVVFTGLSVYFAIKKSGEGNEIIEEHLEKEFDLETKPIADRKTTDALALKLETGKKLAVCYKESLFCAGTSIVCTILANRINSKKIAGLAAALALNEKKLEKLYSASERVFGKGAKDDLKEMTDVDVPFDADTPPVKAKRKHRREEICEFYESFTGTLFESNRRDIDDAIARGTSLITRDPKHILNFNKWRSLIGLEDVPAGTCVGWHRTHTPFKPYTKIIEVDGREVIGIFYEKDPTSDYYSWTIY